MYFIVLIFSSWAPIFMMDKSTFFPLRFCSLAVEFVTKHREAALSHITFTVPLLVLIFCTCSRQVSVSVLLQTFVGPEALSLFVQRLMMCQRTVFYVAYFLRSTCTRPVSDLKTRPASIFLFQQCLLFVKRLRRVDFTFLSGMLTTLMN